MDVQVVVQFRHGIVEHANEGIFKSVETFFQFFQTGYVFGGQRNAIDGNHLVEVVRKVFSLYGFQNGGVFVDCFLQM